MRLFLFYLSVFLCSATLLGWLLNPFIGSTLQMALGCLHLVLIVINIFRWRTLSASAKRAFKIYGVLAVVFALIVLFAYASMVQNYNLNYEKDIMLWLFFGLSGILAIIFTWFLWLMKDAVVEKFAIPGDDVLDNEMIL